MRRVEESGGAILRSPAGGFHYKRSGKYMRIISSLWFVAVAATVASGQVAEKYRGDWLLVNGAVVLHVDADGTMLLRNSGVQGKVSIKENGDFTWNVADQARSGRFSDGKLYLKNDQAGAPKSLEYLEYHHGTKEAASALLEFALRQQAPAAKAFDAVRRRGMEMAIKNNLRQLAAGADQ